MPVFRLIDAHIFPDPEFAEPDGLLAVGGDLNPARILTAYSQGIFPWYAEGDPILWWSPAPRLVLFPNEFHLPRRLLRTIKAGKFTVTTDTAFEQVLTACATASGRREKGTWITPEMQQAYIRLHGLGFAHSVECWREGVLAGGLYGLCLDRIFFGESMFTMERDASKIALAFLIDQALHLDIALIDCQMTTEHLVRFGARELSRETFRAYLDAHINGCLPQKKWRLPRTAKE
ncbi:leucyl/phenylalanyl-tRNA--protein transferase [Desulfobulbus alkaliphilus]|uniref:leucyl/phenylalanyl-tRNA--protein transferase n=1 Tax=Desulfobulbus alkaliphilus TaxID=869814 RepID=UPI0019663F7F|nr:leucyl/phenylalanyl-tRNA--protein transferase [Desulfobulbus alkaliphilus]MBM9537846.1 leucyl/phenylalanyl-tRNA--protein transferase [Desulfobulbus alkaliphilus]